MNNSTPKKSDIDIYIELINSKLSLKHTHAKANRYRDVVDFFYGRNLKRCVEITYNELNECMIKDELPKSIKDLI
jgi:hypothetical protein